MSEVLSSVSEFSELYGRVESWVSEYMIDMQDAVPMYQINRNWGPTIRKRTGMRVADFIAARPDLFIRQRVKEGKRRGCVMVVAVKSI